MQTSARAHVRESTRIRAVDAASVPCASAGFHAAGTIEHNDRDPEIRRAVRRAQAGDMTAIALLYVRYKDNIYGYVLSIVRDEHEAEDVTQHVFMKLMAVIGQYRPGSSPFASWLLRVARNVAVDHLRKRRSVPFEEVHDPNAVSNEPALERRWELEQALDALPTEQREVVVLRHLIGLSPGEIAAKLSRSESSVHGLHHRGRSALRRELVSADCAPHVVLDAPPAAAAAAA
jgi:RNA polymerase sigma-70 factor (ECF subfamily)